MKAFKFSTKSWSIKSNQAHIPLCRVEILKIIVTLLCELENVAIQAHLRVFWQDVTKLKVSLSIQVIMALKVKCNAFAVAMCFSLYQ